MTALRHATVQDCRPTTHTEEILRVVRETGIDEARFLARFQDGSAEAALEVDLALTRRLRIRTLPTYWIQCGDKALLMQSFRFQDFVDAIARVTE